MRNLFKRLMWAYLVFLVAGILFPCLTSSTSSEFNGLGQVSLRKCCEYQGQVYLSPEDCAHCKNSAFLDNEDQQMREFPEVLRNGFRLNEILLPPSASSHPLDTTSADASVAAAAAAANACQHVMNRVTISLHELHSNLSSSTGFLRLGVHGLYPTTDICLDRIGSQKTKPQSPDVDILVPLRIPTLNKCCGLEYAFDVRHNQCVRIRGDRVRSGVRSRSWAKRNRFQQARGSRDHKHSHTHSSAPEETMRPWTPPWKKFMETDISYRVTDNWLYETIKKSNDNGNGWNWAIKNFTSQSCWFQYATRFHISTTSLLKFSLVLNYESNEGVFLRGAWKSIPATDFCVERLHNFGGVCSRDGTSAIFDVNMHYNREQFDGDFGTSADDDVVIIFYIGDDLEDPESYATLMGVSWWAISGFLAVAAVVNVTIIQKNIHGWVFFSYLITSALLNVVAGVFILIVNDDPGKVGCNFFDFLQKFLYLSTLCWMTSINFDLFYAFRLINRKLEPTLQSSAKRFPFYILFSWSLPVLIIFCGWFMGNLNNKSPIPLHHCIIYDYSTIAYMSGPVVVLIGVNLLLFMRTVMIIRGLRNASNRILQRSYVERESFKLFTKLFLMTGPIWILRIVLLVLQIKGSYLTWYGTLIELLFMVPDIAFFLLVILHRKVLERLKIKFPCLQGILCCDTRTVTKPATTATGISAPSNSLRVHRGSYTGMAVATRPSFRMTTFENGHSKLCGTENGHRLPLGSV